MTLLELDDITEVVENEGFEYTFVDYSKFHHIKDNKFHILRMKYLKARQDLMDYLDMKEQEPEKD